VGQHWGGYQIHHDFMTPEEHTAETKKARKDLDVTLQFIKLMSGEAVRGTARDPQQTRRSRERSIAITKLQESIMWLGMDLKDIGVNPNPYPQSYNPDSPVIEPTADGLNL